jgi:uncharacterized protein (DUF885 family)
MALPSRGQDPSVDSFFTAFTDEWVRANPDQATAIRYFSGAEQDALERQMTPRTLEWDKQRVQRAREGLKRLQAFERSRMSPEQLLSADIMQWKLEGIVEGEKYRDDLFPLNQFNGTNVGLLDSLMVSHPLRTAKDAENYIARLQQVGPRMDETLAESRRRAQENKIPPRFILRATGDQMRRFVESAPGQNPLVTSFYDKISAINSIPAEKRAELRRAAETIVNQQVYPSWKKSIAFLDSLIPQANDDAGLWRYPGGAEAYAYFLRQNTTTSLSADEIHAIGLREVARIEKEMDVILRRLGRADGSLRDRVEKLKKDLAYPSTQDGRKLIMADVDKFIRDAEKRSASMFELIPKAPVVAEPFPRYREANAAANYTAPALDGSRPGTVRIPLRPDRMTKFGLRSLTYHESVPGHHYQIALQQENATLPRFRQINAFGGFTSYIEGWGLYAERLTVDEGWYDGDLEGRLGQLDAELFRARRLVVDTGIHAEHWSRQQAIDYGIEPSEVERYVVNPGQACAYMIGELKLIELRERTRTALGERFSIKAYHSLIQRIGAAPLDIIKAQVDQFIQVNTR